MRLNECYAQPQPHLFSERESGVPAWLIYFHTSFRPLLGGFKLRIPDEMIFVTVGTDLPFDRLMRAVDSWAADRGRQDVFAQVGKGGWIPRHVKAVEFLDPSDFVNRFLEARIIVGHAGMGTILSALRYEKPIVVMPRRASLGEQRNEHQLATARRLAEIKKVHVAFTERELVDMLDHSESLSVRSHIGAFAEERLLNTVRTFIQRSEILSLPAIYAKHFCK